MHPFVHRFTTENTRYVFDVHTGTIAAVSEAVFAIIERYSEAEEEQLLRQFSNRFRVDALQRAFASIRKARQQQGLFRADRPQHEIVAFDRDSLTEAANAELRVVTLGVTEACNLNCSYCVYSGQYPQRRNASGRHMSWKTAQRAIDYLKRHNRPELQSPVLGFYGGEPLLRFPFVKRATAYAQSILPRDRLGLTITTNGTVFTTEMLDFLETNQFSVLVSLDGPQQYHDRTRRTKDGTGSWRQVMRNLETIREHYPRLFRHRLSLAVTMTPQASYRELDGFFGDLGIPVRSGLLEMDSAEEYAEFGAVTDYEYVVQKWRRAALAGELADVRAHPQSVFVRELFNESLRKVHTRNQASVRPGQPARHGLCVPGAFKLFVGVDGTLYPCEKLEGYPAMIIGHLDRGGVLVDRVAALLDEFRNLDWIRCENCWISPFCTCCLLHTFSRGRISNEKLDALCNMWRQHYHQMLENYCTVLEENEQAFETVV